MHILIGFSIIIISIHTYKLRKLFETAEFCGQLHEIKTSDTTAFCLVIPKAYTDKIFWWNLLVLVIELISILNSDCVIKRYFK